MTPFNRVAFLAVALILVAALSVLKMMTLRDTDAMSATPAPSALPRAAALTTQATPQQHPARASAAADFAGNTSSALRFRADRCLLMDIPPPFSMGLTNMLIFYAEALHLANISSRALVLPARTEPDVAALLDVENTAAATGVRVLRHSQYLQMAQPQQSRQRAPRLKLPSRSAILTSDASRARARSRLEADIRRLDGHPAIRVGNTFMHTFESGAMFTKLAFAESVRTAAELLSSRIGAIDVALHARFESDIAGFGAHFAVPRAERLSLYIERCVLPRIATASARRRTLFVAGGSSLASDLRRVIVERISAAGFRVEFSRAAAPSPRSAPLHPTNHVDAAIDALVAARAPVFVGADYSTFSRAIQLRRCAEGRPHSLFVTYDHNLEFGLQVSTCDDLQRDAVFATTPHAYVPGKAAPMARCP